MAACSTWSSRRRSCSSWYCRRAGLEIPRLAAACRSFLENHPALRADLDGAAFIRVPGVSLKDGMFVARVTGTSMEPLIPDGSWCLFRPCPAGSREGRIVLVQLGTDGAGENGGRFTVKKYHSELSTDLAVTTDGWRHRRIQLLPLNPAFEPIEIEPGVAADIVIVGEFLTIAPKLCRPRRIVPGSRLLRSGS